MLEAGGEAMLGVPGNSIPLPRHFGAWKSTRLAVVGLLVARGPAGVARARNSYGRAPVVCAEHNTGPAVGKIKALLLAAIQ